MKIIILCLMPIMLFSCQDSTKMGSIDFLERASLIEDYKKSDVLDFTNTSNIGFVAHLKQPLTNYLKELSPDDTIDELCTKGNYQFTFYVDEEQVYQENLNTGAGTCDQKSRPSFSVPLASTGDEDSWGRYIWMRFLFRGTGDKALFSRGEHSLRIDIRPYVNNGEIIVGDIIASGETVLNTIKPIASKSQMEIQNISSGSGWETSDNKFDSALIEKLNKKILERDFRDITSVVIAKNGKLLLEEYFNGADRQTLHDPRSVGKTFASTAMGLAIRDGHIKSVQASLRDFYNLKNYDNYDARKGDISLESLLTMSSGFDADDSDYNSPGNEENMYPTENWVKFALDLKIDQQTINHRTWKYFTAGVVVLGEIIHDRVPGGLEGYLDKQLFAPMGITDYQWQYTTTEVPNTAGGLQLRAIDFAKFGQVYKNNGIWNGQQLIPSAWVEESLAAQVVRSEDKDEQYGYLFWKDTLQAKGRGHKVTYCTGNGGNKIYIFDDLPFVVVVTATAYNRPYAHAQVKKMMEEYILPALL